MSPILSPPLTPEKLKNFLEEFLTNQLGQYEINSDLTLPAIFVGEPPATYKATGLEVILPRAPNVIDSERAGAGNHLQTEWEIDLYQRSGQESALFAAADRLLRVFPNVRGIYIPSTGEPEVFPSYRIIFTHFDLYQPIPFPR